MPVRQMHSDEFPTDAPLVRRLVASQFPQWAHLPIQPVDSSGTDNAMYGLGAEMAVRLPRIPSAAVHLTKEQEWLPKLAPHLPLPVPIPLARGEPAAGYPWPWSVCMWLEGENAAIEQVVDPHEAATTLAGFVSALEQIDATAGPPPGPHNFFRGVPLAERDAPVRAALEKLHDLIDIDAATAAWEAALATPPWPHSLVWIHGDLSPRNLLVAQGRISAVIDFGGLGLGDPACDLLVAWNLLTDESRQRFRTELEVDDATWMRGRGWALSCALIALPYYLETNPVIGREARHVIREVLASR